MKQGHDTTSASLIWTFFELGHHSEIQEQCFEELQKIFEDSNRFPSYHDLMQMTYLKRVIQETLRLYPSVPVISRKFNVDIQLSEFQEFSRLPLLKTISTIPSLFSTLSLKNEMNKKFHIKKGLLIENRVMQ